jgi:hypothetical protein
MAARDLKKLRASINGDLAQLNYDLNQLMGDFFTKLQINLKHYDKYIGNVNSIVPGIDSFTIIIDVAEELYPDEMPFTSNFKNREVDVIIIRQCCYLIGNELGLSYAHMVKVINDMHSKKMVHPSTLVHSVNKTRDALAVNDSVITPIWSSILSKIQEGNFKKTFVSLTNIDTL